MTAPPSIRTGPSRATRDARLGERLRQLRVAAGLTQSELAGDRCSKEYVSQIERGKTRPTQETVDWLAKRLGVDPSFLASGVSSDERTRIEATLARAEGLLESGAFDEAVVEFGHVLPAAVATGVPELEVRALTGAGWSGLRRGDVRAALATFERVRVLVEGPPFSDVERADALFRLGACRFRLSSVSSAVGLFDAALELASGSALPCDLLQSRILTWRSRCRRRQRDWEAAHEDLERALELAEGIQDRRGVAHINFQASLVAERNGQWVLARTYAERAKAVFEELNDRLEVGQLLNNLGGLQFLLGNADLAVEHLTSAFAVALELGEDVEAGRAVSSLAQVHLRSGEPVVAEEQARKALELLGSRVDELEEIGNAQLVLGRALLEQERLEESETVLHDAEATLAQLSSGSHVAAAWIARGDLAAARGDDAAAARFYKAAAETLQDFRF